MLKHIVFHKGLLDSGKWYEMSALQQIGNLGSEVSRFLNLMNSIDDPRYQEVELRMFELFDMIMGDPKWQKTGTLREICRLREVITDYIYGSNEYSTTPERLHKYFYIISVAANEERRLARLSKNIT